MITSCFYYFIFFNDGNILDYRVLEKYRRETFEQIWGIEFVTAISNLNS